MNRKLNRIRYLARFYPERLIGRNVSVETLNRNAEFLRRGVQEEIRKRYEERYPK